VRTRGLTQVELIVFLLIALGATSLAATARCHARERAGLPRCANNLKALGLACLEYSDDKRFFPHSARIVNLAGDAWSDEATFVADKLVAFGYVQDPKVFVCPSSLDEATGEAPRRTPLLASEDLSYGYTRHGLTTGSMSTNILFGDKARLVPELAEMPIRGGHMQGQHRGWIQVVHLDSSFARIGPEGDGITTHTIASIDTRGTFTTSGFLGVLPD